MGSLSINTLHHHHNIVSTTSSPSSAYTSFTHPWTMSSITHRSLLVETYHVFNNPYTSQLHSSTHSHGWTKNKPKDIYKTKMIICGFFLVLQVGVSLSIKTEGVRGKKVFLIHQFFFCFAGNNVWAYALPMAEARETHVPPLLWPSQNLQCSFPLFPATLMIYFQPSEWSFYKKKLNFLCLNYW